MFKTNASILLVTVSALFTSLAPAHAQPVIEWADYYTDYWYDNPFGKNGHHHVVCGYVAGDETLTVKATDGMQTVILNTQGNWHCRFVEEDGFKLPGALTIVAQDRSGEAKKKTHDLDKTIRMDPARAISISDRGTTPVISWAGAQFAQRYYVRIVDSADIEIHRSPPLENPTYQIPAGIMTADDVYYFRILIQNYDDCKVYRWGRCLENRSSTWIEFIPSDTLKP